MNDARQWFGDLSSQVLAVAAMALGLPMIVFLALRRWPQFDPIFGSHSLHFIIVSIVAAAALVLALAVMLAARHLPDARTFFLAMGFLTMAGIFLAHGLGTAPFLGAHHVGSAAATAGYSDDEYGAPSAGYGDAPAEAVAGDAGYGDAGYGDGSPAEHAGHGGNSGHAGGGSTPSTAQARLQVVGFSAQLSLVISAVFFGLAVADFSRRLTNLLIRRWSTLALLVIAGVAVYVWVALAAPKFLLSIPLSSWALNWTVAVVAWICFAFAGWRFLQAYRLSLLPLQGTMALAMTLLLEAQLFMIEGPTWHISWWEYHVVMLAGFLCPVLGILWQYRTSGDLSVIIEGLFLREAVTGMQAGDPDALNTLGAAVAAKDGETSAHVERVSRLSVAIGERLDLPAARLEVLRWAGRLHDLGKIGVPDSILLKPGRLTEGEFRVMQLHSARGWQVARRSGVLAQAAAGIRGHHERWNGSGYPDGLVGEQIPLEARIIAVADVWDALTSDRPYRAAMSHEEARAIIRHDSGVLLDQRCVDALFDVLGQARPAPADKSRDTTLGAGRSRRVPA